MPSSWQHVHAMRVAYSLSLLFVAAIAGLGCGSDGDDSAPPGAAASGETLRVAAVADIGIEASGIATLDAMAAQDPDVSLGIGDLSYAGPGSEERFCRVVQEHLGAEAPFEIVSGNHEEDVGEDGRIANYAACLPDRLGAVGDYGRQYYFDVGRLARFIFISPDLTIGGRYHYYGPDDDGSNTPELDWLLRAADGARESGIRWVVVGMHKNCISVGQYYCDVYQDLFSALIEHRVDLVISGHDHSYQRSHQIAAPAPGCPAAVVDSFDRDCVADDDNRLRQGRGTVFTISGAGGAELYDLHENDPEEGYIATAMGAETPGRRYGFLLMELTKQRLSGRFVGSRAGGYSDSFVIESREGS